MRDVKLILEQLDSWKTGYLPPSAMILMDEAAKLIRDQQDTIEALTDAVDNMAKKVAEVAPAPEEKVVATKAPQVKPTKSTSVRQKSK